jgi:hypothetical protein
MVAPQRHLQVRVGVRHVHEVLADRDGQTALFPQFSADALLKVFAGPAFAPWEFPQAAEHGILAALAQQYPPAPPDDAGADLDVRNGFSLPLHGRPALDAVPAAASARCVGATTGSGE